MLKTILLAILTLCLFYTTAYAEHALNISSHYHSTTETVDIDISISDNPGIAAFDITLNFDNNVIYPISIQNGVVDNIVSNIQSDNPSNIGCLSIVMARPNNFNENGVLFTVKFAIRDKKATNAIIGLEGTMCNQNQDSIELETIKQNVKISSTNISYSSSENVSVQLNSDTIINDIDNSSKDSSQQSLNDIKDSSIKFSDISSVPWAYEAIASLYSDGIIEGVNDTTFAPQKNITRADFIVLLMRKLNFNEQFDENFEDVSDNMYYYKEIGIAKALDIALGVGGNQFKPQKNISRQDMFVLAYRALLKSNRINEMESEALDQFIDKGQIDDYAKNALSNLAHNNYIQGNNGYINPKGNATRAEAAVFIYRLQ